MYISVEEFQEDPLQYIALRGNIILTHEGKPLAQLINMHKTALDSSHMSIEEKMERIKSIFGILPDTIDPDAVREERLS